MNTPNIQIDKEKLSNVVSKGKRTIKKAAFNVADAVKDGRELISDHVNQAIVDFDRKLLQPVFPESFDSEEYEVPHLIRIVDYDKKHMEKKACEGSLGFETATKHMKVLTLFSESALSQSSICFYPSVKETFYYIDPCRPNHFICLDDYFDYLKKAKVDELETIAQDLGAKHVKITFKEKKKTLVAQNKKAHLAPAGAKIDTSQEISSEDFSNFEVAADVSFTGNNMPIAPQPVYFKDETDIKALIRARMNPDANNPIKSKTYKMNCSKSTGITEKIAANIDEALSQFKCSGTASVSSEAQRECRTILEYHIEF